MHTEEAGRIVNRHLQDFGDTLALQANVSSEVNFEVVVSTGQCNMG